MAYAVSWLKGVTSVINTFTTAAGLSWVPVINRETGRWHILDGVIPGGRPCALLSDIPGAVATVFNSPVSGATVTASAGDQKLQLTPAGTLSSLTVVLPPSPANDQEFDLSTSQTISTLTVNGAGGATVLGGNMTLMANGGAGWRYRSSNTTWYRRY